MFTTFLSKLLIDVYIMNLSSVSIILTLRILSEYKAVRTGAPDSPFM